MRRTHSSERRGSSLVIVLTTIAAGAVIVGLAVVVLARMIGFSGAAGQHLARTVTVARLAEQFRDDVAAARSVNSNWAVGDTDSNENDDAAAGLPITRTVARADRQGRIWFVSQGQSLTLTLGERHTITYEVHDGAVERIVEQDGQRKHSERYDPAGLTAILPEIVEERVNTNSPQFARLRLERKPLVESHEPQPPHAVVIEAQVGRDHRFSRPEARP